MRFDGTQGYLTIGQDAVPAEQKAGLTTAMGRFVPVYDHDGVLLAKPDEERRDTALMSWRNIEGPRFQFDLQTMLLFVVVAACIANLFGLRYRSSDYQAVVRLEAFDPKINYVNDEVWRLDFSGCVDKPTDDDLVYLEPLSEVVILNLEGAPITDAGLMHLKGLKKLNWVNLARTDVSERGMAQLRRALPKASIAKYITTRSSTPPVPAQPAKGK